MSSGTKKLVKLDIDAGNGNIKLSLRGFMVTGPRDNAGYNEKDTGLNLSKAGSLGAEA